MISATININRRLKKRLRAELIPSS